MGGEEGHQNNRSRKERSQKVSSPHELWSLFVLVCDSEVLHGTYRQEEPHRCLPTTAGFFRKRKEVCLCSTTFVYIRQLLALTNITVFRHLFSKRSSGKSTATCTFHVSDRIHKYSVSIRCWEAITIAYLMDLFSLGWLCCAFLSLTPVQGRHLEF